MHIFVEPVTYVYVCMYVYMYVCMQKTMHISMYVRICLPQKPALLIVDLNTNCTAAYNNSYHVYFCITFTYLGVSKFDGCVAN